MRIRDVKASGLISVCLVANALLLIPIASFAQSVPRGPGQAVASREPIFVTGLPSLVEYPSTLADLATNWVLPSKPICISFSVRSIGQVTPLLRITSEGIGEARLLDLTGKKAILTCAESHIRASTAISLLHLTDKEHRVLLILPESAFPSATGGGKGRVLFLGSDLGLSYLSIVVRRADYTPFVKVFVWFWSIFVSALIAAVSGLIVYSIQKRLDLKSAEKDMLDKVRRDEEGEFKKFFSHIYQTLMVLPDENYLTSMENELAANRMIFSLPPQAREHLLAALRTKNRSKMADEFKKIFPNFQELILKPLK